MKFYPLQQNASLLLACSFILWVTQSSISYASGITNFLPGEDASSDRSSTFLPPTSVLGNVVQRAWVSTEFSSALSCSFLKAWLSARRAGGAQPQISDSFNVLILPTVQELFQVRSTFLGCDPASLQCQLVKKKHACVHIHTHTECASRCRKKEDSPCLWVSVGSSGGSSSPPVCPH